MNGAVKPGLQQQPFDEPSGEHDAGTEQKQAIYNVFWFRVKLVSRVQPG
jgi:hypothetical protein